MKALSKLDKMDLPEDNTETTARVLPLSLSPFRSLSLFFSLFPLSVYVPLSVSLCLSVSPSLPLLNLPLSRKLAEPSRTIRKSSKFLNLSGTFSRSIRLIQILTLLQRGGRKVDGEGSKKGGKGLLGALSALESMEFQE
eukprot:847550-Amorphochlora_amoeboformis.AAC.1